MDRPHKWDDKWEYIPEETLKLWLVDILATVMPNDDSFIWI